MEQKADWNKIIFLRISLASLQGTYENTSVKQQRSQCDQVNFRYKPKPKPPDKFELFRIFQRSSKAVGYIV